MPLFYSFCLLLPNLVPKKEKPAPSEVLMNVDETSRDFKDLSKTVLVHGGVVPIGHFEMLFMSIEARHKTPSGAFQWLKHVPQEGIAWSYSATCPCCISHDA